jgi:hypothetical protein
VNIQVLFVFGVKTAAQHKADKASSHHLITRESEVELA